jgi:hypothetical protein
MSDGSAIMGVLSVDVQLETAAVSQKISPGHGFGAVNMMHCQF